MLKKGAYLGFILLFVSSMTGLAQEVDLIDKAQQARWETTDGQVLTFGVDGGEKGIAKYSENVALEDGKTYKKVLFTHPQGKRYGNILGTFSNISIPSRGGKVLIGGGFLQGAEGSDGVIFSLHFKATGEEKEAAQKVRVQKIPMEQRMGISSGIVLCTFDAKYDGKIDQVEGDLSQVAGQTGDIVLAIQAGLTPNFDWAVWTEAKLVFGDMPASGQQPKATLVHTLSGHNNRIYRASFSPNGRYVVTSSGDNLAKIWDAKSGNDVRTLRGHSSHVFSARFSPDSKRVVTAGGETAKLWDVSTGEQVKMLIGHSKIVHSAAFSADGTVIVTTSEEGTAKLWNAQNGQEIRTIEVDTDWIYDAVISPNGRTVAIGGQNGLLGLWNVSTGRQIRTFDGHSRAITSVCFSPDGKLLASASIDNTARIWEVSSGRLLQRLKGNEVGEASFSLDGQYIVTANAGGEAKVFRVQDGEEIITIEHSSPATRVFSATFSPDGKYIVTAGDDQTAKIWSVDIPAK